MRRITRWAFFARRLSCSSRPWLRTKVDNAQHKQDRKAHVEGQVEATQGVGNAVGCKERGRVRAESQEVLLASAELVAGGMDGKLAPLDACRLKRAPQPIAIRAGGVHLASWQPDDRLNTRKHAVQCLTKVMMVVLAVKAAGVPGRCDRAKQCLAVQGERRELRMGDPAFSCGARRMLRTTHEAALLACVAPSELAQQHLRRRGGKPRLECGYEDDMNIRIRIC
eukprot:929218-Prymnesium_polylepis.2